MLKAGKNVTGIIVRPAGNHDVQESTIHKVQAFSITYVLFWFDVLTEFELKGKAYVEFSP